MTLSLEIAGVAFAANLARHGGRPAILTGARAVTYSELAGHVQDFSSRLGTARRLVLLVADNSLDSLVAYLAALSSGHPLLLAPADNPGALASLVTAYDPDVIVRPGPGGLGSAAGATSAGPFERPSTGPQLEEVRAETVHDLHPDLALLLSTSGSTGSPKLVRLSHSNLQSNAESIAEYLGITSDDRAMTSLPMYYCYGLSVINSHLLRGASLVLTSLSVVDECFWQLVRNRGATSFAAVPYTFELLDRAGFADRELPTLRYVTQAGGRLAPEAVTRYARLGRRNGWDLFVMYGQTEATARMAYLPPRLAEENAGTIGVPVPGGSFRIDPVPGMEDGELVYNGPNVMLGYARTPADLALGRVIQELRTGDLARQHPNGLFEVVGRRSRFVKIVGLRIELGQVEKVLAGLGINAACAGTDAQLVAAVEGTHDERMLAKALAQELGLPRTAVSVHAVQELPRLGTGKTDYPAILDLAGPASASATPPAAPVPGSTGATVSRSDGTPDDDRPAAALPPENVRRIFAEALERDDIGDDDTFVSLGGDSLSYVAASVRLERALGHLPANWHVTPIKDLTPRKLTQSARRLRRIVAPQETSIVLRAVAILTIVSTHIGLIQWPGTAHILMALAGYNFARFQLGGERLHRLRHQLRSLARVVVPTVAFIAAVMLVAGDKFHYTTANLFLLNTIMGPAGWTDAWHFWFIEVLVYVLVGVSALLAIPWVHRAEKRFPLVFPVALVGVGLLFRYNLVPFDILHTRPVLWLFALGWAIARARTWPQRLALSILAALTLPGFFDNPSREATVLAGILLIAWIPAIPLPRVLHCTVGAVASASLYIYVTHWVVFPDFKENQPELALALSVAVGIAYWAMAVRIMGAAERGRSGLWRRLHRTRTRQPATQTGD